MNKGSRHKIIVREIKIQVVKGKYPIHMIDRKTFIPILNCLDVDGRKLSHIISGRR